MGAVGMTREWALDGNITSAGIVLLAYGLLRVIAGLLVKDNRKLLVMNVIYGLIVVVLAVLVFANLALIGSCILAATDIAPKAAGMPVEPPGWITVWTIRYRSSLTIRTVISPVPPFMPGMVTAGIAPKSMCIWFSFVFGKGTSRPNEPRDAFSFISRRVWDSNPRDLTSNGFQDDNHYWTIADFSRRYRKFTEDGRRRKVNKYKGFRIFVRKTFRE